MADIITLTEYKTAKGITTAEYDLQLTALTSMANSFIEKYCGKVFGEGEYIEKNEGFVDAFNKYVFQVKNAPIISVQNIDLHFIGTNSSVALNLDYLDIFEQQGYAYYLHSLATAGIVLRDEYAENFYYTITYSGGEAPPEALKLAAINIISDTFEYLNRTNTAIASGVSSAKELSSVTIGDYSESYVTGGSIFSNQHSASTGIMLTATVKSVLDLYKITGQSVM